MIHLSPLSLLGGGPRHSDSHLALVLAATPALHLCALPPAPEFLQYSGRSSWLKIRSPSPTSKYCPRDLVVFSIRTISEDFLVGQVSLTKCRPKRHAERGRQSHSTEHPDRTCKGRFTLIRYADTWLSTGPPEAYCSGGYFSTSKFCWYFSKSLDRMA